MQNIKESLAVIQHDISGIYKHLEKQNGKVFKNAESIRDLENRILEMRVKEETKEDNKGIKNKVVIGIVVTTIVITAFVVAAGLEVGKIIETLGEIS